MYTDASHVRQRLRARGTSSAATRTSTSGDVRRRAAALAWVLLAVTACDDTDSIAGARQAIRPIRPPALARPTAIRPAVLPPDMVVGDYLCGGYGGAAQLDYTDCEGLDATTTGSGPVVLNLTRVVTAVAVEAFDAVPYSEPCVDDRFVPTTCTGVNYLPARGRATAYDSVGAVVGTSEFAVPDSTFGSLASRSPRHRASVAW